MVEQRQNWAGNYTFKAESFQQPETLEQLQTVVRRAERVKALGSGHSFNAIADTPGTQVSLGNFQVEPQIDRERRTLTVGAGMKYGQVCRLLDEAGFAVHNMASLPHISIAGAIATATHGSGDRNGNLATAVSALELVTADGQVVTLSREKDGEKFAGAVVSLGGLGIVSRVTLDLVPAFQVRQVVYENLPLEQLEAHFDEIVSSAYSVSLFTRWEGDYIQQVWQKHRVSDDKAAAPETEWFGAKAATVKRHPILGLPAEASTEQLGQAGPWYERLPHFRVDFTPSSGEELQSEYLVPRAQAVAALRAVNRLRERISPLLQVSEIRTIAADNLWLSPCYRQERVGFHFTWLKDWEAVRQLLPLLEESLAPFDAVPHWGKLFTTPPQRVQAMYQRLGDFRQLLAALDPQGKFRNAYLDKYIYG
ncbi:MAG TPA: FAD-binding protein [Chloroflexia bacterium]|nr:FAD-binding protein [Chloroflexia bacterium]